MQGFLNLSQSELGGLPQAAKDYAQAGVCLVLFGMLSIRPLEEVSSVLRSAVQFQVGTP